jgi:hypothetical protein
MPCGRKRPTYKAKADAKRHGAITYGDGNYHVYKVKSGWKVAKK